MSDKNRLIELNRKAKLYAQEKADERGGLVCIDDEVDYLIANGVILPPCKVGDTFYGVNETSYDAYCVYGFKWGKRRGEDENVLIVLTTYDMEFVWGEEAFLTPEEAEKALENYRKNTQKEGKL